MEAEDDQALAIPFADCMETILERKAARQPRLGQDFIG
jgi:hypothetical protein